jgi:hypothetical protein
MIDIISIIICIIILILIIELIFEPRIDNIDEHIILWYNSEGIRKWILLK